MTLFPSDIAGIEARIERIDPIRYGATRNFGNGAVTYLSPYISRGVISTKQVFNHVLSLSLPWNKIEKLVQELAWRDYWQQIWITKGDKINQDLKHPQTNVSNHQISNAIRTGQTGIHVIDEAIHLFLKNGYMHNHIRMYVASLACNIANSHWKTPAQWMYYHLLDGDWASNALSWQWVAGSNANKKYYANQANINKYFKDNQKGSFLDINYEEFQYLECPEVLRPISLPDLSSNLPQSDSISINSKIPTLIYNYYNLDPYWKHGVTANRILLLEPSTFRKYPVARKCLDWALSLGKNIPDLQLFTGEFSALLNVLGHSKIIFKEHPLNGNYVGHEEERDWMFDIQGYYPSFFAFWKQCKKEMNIR